MYYKICSTSTLQKFKSTKRYEDPIPGLTPGWSRFGELSGSSTPYFCTGTICQLTLICLLVKNIQANCLKRFVGQKYSSKEEIPPELGGCEEEAVVDEGDEGDDTKDEQPEPEEHVDFLRQNLIDFLNNCLISDNVFLS